MPPPKGVSEVSPALAFRHFVEMGVERSIYGLHKRLHEHGLKIGRATLMRWQKKYEWDQAVEDGDKLAADAKTIEITASELVEKINNEPEIPFTVAETFEGTANAIHTMTSAMSAVVTAHMTRMLATAPAIDQDEILSIARVTRDLASAAADMHRALNPPAPKGKQSETPLRDAQTGLLYGAPTPGGPPSVDELIAAFDNPPGV